MRPLPCSRAASRYASSARTSGDVFWYAHSIAQGTWADKKNAWSCCVSAGVSTTPAHAGNEGFRMVLARVWNTSGGRVWNTCGRVRKTSQRKTVAWAAREVVVVEKPMLRCRETSGSIAVTLLSLNLLTSSCVRIARNCVSRAGAARRLAHHTASCSCFLHKLLVVSNGALELLNKLFWWHVGGVFHRTSTIRKPG